MTDSGEQISWMGRRSFLWASALAAAMPIVSEATLAHAARASFVGEVPPDAVLINANENPLGPCKAACDAIAGLGVLGGRYDRLDDTDRLASLFASQNGLNPESVAVYAGSSEPLHYAVLAFTSPDRGLVLAQPSYEAPVNGTRCTLAPATFAALTGDYAHDMKAMVAADPTAGVIYVCNPNNPTGTVTPREQILWALANKPAGSLLLVDEAYIQLTEERTVLDQVAAGKDLIVLRSFSKVYGMAGIRCGFAVGRPDLLAKLTPYFQNMMPVTALAAALASLKDPDVVPTRRKWIADTRRETIAWLRGAGYKVVGEPQTNCFMIDTGRDGTGVIHAMRTQNVYIGRLWPEWPKAVRITVGSPDDMAKFRTAFKTVMNSPALAVAGPPPPGFIGKGRTTFLS